MKIFLGLLLITFSAEIALSQTLVEKFYRSGFNNSGTLELYDDNTFIAKYYAISCVADTNKKRESFEEINGAYTLKKNHLHFTPEYKIYKNYDDKEGQRSNEYIQEGSFFKFHYDILEYRDTKILISVKQPMFESGQYNFRFDNHYIYLANKINETDKEAYFDSDFWRTDKIFREPIMIQKDIKSLFPEGYKGYILERPLKGLVKKIEKVSFLNPDKELNPNWTKYRITLDLGKSDGIKPMMVFYGQKDCNGRRCSLKIKEVFEQECSGYLENYSPHYNCSLEKHFTTKKENASQ